MILFTRYYPDEDSVDNCGFLMEVNDFSEAPDAEMRSATKHLPAEPWVETLPDGCVLLPVECETGPGFTFIELRKAADKYRRGQA